MGPSPLRTASLLRLASVGFFVVAALIPSVASAQNTISTVAGGGGLSPGPAISSPIGPSAGVAVDQFGNVFFASPYHQVVYRVSSLGQLSIAAGIGPPQGAFGQGNGGPATSAVLAFPTSVVVDSAGNLFIGGVGDVRRVDGITGIITTVAGGGCCSLGDGGRPEAEGSALPNSRHGKIRGAPAPRYSFGQFLRGVAQGANLRGLRPTGQAAGRRLDSDGVRRACRPESRQACCPATASPISPQ
jgi:hypothetical protein